ncbi:MAG: PilT/PilU family type 4a pilus ATPase [Candidatus Omnitrophica bacterium]|nr:PilT/PilU family type 4a pilus ATPase [Candidatus Omnitrophota bacterium]MDD5237479.1 PilT/PilU family type 4a pilus ATPase [Candidatus Omnitrophota bacterium]
MKIKELLKSMVEQNASDLFYRAGGVARLRVGGKVVPVDDELLTVDNVLAAVEELTTPQQRENFKKTLDIDFALYSDEFDRRFRVNIFMQRNWPSIVIRCINRVINTFEELGLPGEVLRKLCMETRGLVLLTGSMGSGKSTTIASMIEYINSNKNKHILTIEEPVEFTFKDKKSIVNQRELGIDVSSYAVALRAFTFQSPDVIFIGNIRDYLTMSAALTAAETGVLVFSTLHTVNAAQSVERIVNFFPPHQHPEIRIQLSSLLKGVISLRLIPTKDGSGRVPAYEAMLLTPTISRLIREGKVWEIPQFIDDGAIFGMQSFNQSLIKLIKEGKITEEEALNYADNKEEFIQALRGIRRA